MPQDQLHVNDFVTGLLLGLRLRGVERMGYDQISFSSGCKVAFNRLCEKAEAEHIEVEFSIIPHYLHGDSPAAVAALQENQAIAPLESPFYDALNIRCSQDGAMRKLEQIPGTTDLWLELADAFLGLWRSATPYGRPIRV